MVHLSERGPKGLNMRRRLCTLALPAACGRWTSHQPLRTTVAATNLHGHVHADRVLAPFAHHSLAPPPSTPGGDTHTAEPAKCKFLPLGDAVPGSLFRTVASKWDDIMLEARNAKKTGKKGEQRTPSFAQAALEAALDWLRQVESKRAAGESEEAIKAVKPEHPIARGGTTDGV